MLKWPSWQEFRVYVAVSLTVLIVFTVVYGWTNAEGAAAVTVYHFWFPFELEIPLIPEFIFAYVSLNVLTVVPLFTLEVDEMKRLGLSMCVSILIAGIIFWLFPARTGWERLTFIPRYNDFYQVLYKLDNVTNTFPSLHIGVSYLTTRVIVFAKPALRPLWIWFMLIVISVVLTHQHHLFDIVGGGVLAEFCFRYFYLIRNQKAADGIRGQLS